ncbi:helix-turn-helix transcriptional regulator [Saccharibacillus deserti]|uniref:helix-turn-helix transcriptional regulator n=1 Tax=Saccharibacillus deserti TaxID=1634444 RepID=UPI0015581753|nr:YafY family protein [Saccharibacillus deserti]
MRGDRLLKIVLLLQSRSRMSTRELAEELEVTPRTVSRDLEALGQSGIPIVAYRGRFGGWSLMEGYRSGLTGMTPDEAAALLLRASSGPLQDLGFKEPYERALHKLRTVYPEPRPKSADFLSRRLLIDESGWHARAAGVPESLPVCQEAVLEQRQLRFVYVKSAEEPTGSPVGRIVDPLGLAVKRSVWYLVAREDTAIKTFRVSKITEAQCLERTFDYPGTFNLADYWQESLRTFPDTLPRYEAGLRVEAEALEAFRSERYVRVRHTELLEDGGYAVQADLATAEFALRFVLGLGTAVRVLEPRELAERVAAEAERIMKLYRPLPVETPGSDTTTEKREQA